jgi:hypothetical protein
MLLASRCWHAEIAAAQVGESRNGSAEAGIGVVVKSADICLGQGHHFISEMLEERLLCSRSGHFVTIIR